MQKCDQMCGVLLYSSVRPIRVFLAFSLFTVNQGVFVRVWLIVVRMSTRKYLNVSPGRGLPFIFLRKLMGQVSEFHPALSFFLPVSVEHSSSAAVILLLGKTLALLLMYTVFNFLGTVNYWSLVRNTLLKFWFLHLLMNFYVITRKVLHLTPIMNSSIRRKQKFSVINPAYTGPGFLWCFYFSFLQFPWRLAYSPFLTESSSETYRADTQALELESHIQHVWGCGLLQFKHTPKAHASWACPQSGPIWRVYAHKRYGLVGLLLEGCLEHVCPGSG